MYVKSAVFGVVETSCKSPWLILLKYQYFEECSIFGLNDLLFRPDNGGRTGGYNDAEGDSQYLRDLPNYNSSSEVSYQNNNRLIKGLS